VTLILLLKVVHILAAIVAVGSNVTYAFWLRRAGLDRDRLIFTIEGIRLLDSWIANPAYVLVLLTGLGMVALGAFSRFTTSAAAGSGRAGTSRSTRTRIPRTTPSARCGSSMTTA